MSAAVSLVTWLAMHYLPVLSGGSQWLEDFRVANFSPGVSQNDDIVVLTITEETLATFKYRSPVQRKFLADLLELLDPLQAKAVGLDLIFDQPTDPGEDARLQETMRALKTPLVVAIGDERAGFTAAQLNFQSTYLSGISKGLANLPKEDGIVRSSFDGRLVDGEMTSGFAYRLAEASGTEPPPGRWRLTYSGTTDDGSPVFRRYPAHTAHLLPKNWLSGKIILVGADMPQKDRHRTPLALRVNQQETTTPGVVIHANILAQILDARVLPQLPGGASALVLIAFVVFGVGLALIDVHLLAKLALGTLGVGALWYLGFSVFRNGGPILPLLSPTLGFAMGLGIATGYGGRKEREVKKFLRKAFGQYLNPDVIEKLMTDPGHLCLGGEVRDMSFIFTDIKGFTTLSETLPAEQSVSILQEYLDGMVTVAHDYSGTIDKFIGDAVVVFFGAPTDQADHPQRALDCALAMDAFADSFSKRLQADNINFGLTRIGVHTGQAIVGNIGGQRRFEYTAVGDTVNTAARLESVNNHFGTRLCVSGNIVERCDGVDLRPVAQVVLKGKEHAIDLFTSWDEDSDAPLQEYRNAYQAIADMEDGVLQRLETLAMSYPDDSLVAFHLARLRDGPRGVYIKMETK